MRRLAPIALALCALLLNGCLFGAPSPSPSASASASRPASVAPSGSLPPPTATVAPTPGPDKIPTFTAGAKVATGAAGLRVRSGPGTKQGVVALLPTGSNLVVELGPVRTDGYGWYLVRDADARAPKFEEGWVAAGFMPSPFLAPADFVLPFNPIVAGFSHEGNAENGPVRIEDANYAVRWAASVLPGGGGCSFSVDLVPGSGTAVPAIRATLGTAPAPGNLYGDFFASHPELKGDIFVRVTSDCSWALTFVRTATIPA
ncbi:MAG: SH3 domain-containing protein [Chloroflexota bacterium]